ncbi:MAG TPA: hypothetical protein VGU66_08600 [Candidatus Elarobacter sp.]|nr:hypothetical protein [Candidatus Elarobacter sp.]
MNPFDRMLQRLGLQRVRSRGRRELWQPQIDDGGGDAAAGGVTARLPKVPPRLSPGNALAIPREEPMADLCSDVVMSSAPSEKRGRRHLLVA